MRQTSSHEGVPDREEPQPDLLEVQLPEGRPHRTQLCLLSMGQPTTIASWEARGDGPSDLCSDSMPSPEDYQSWEQLLPAEGEVPDLRPGVAEREDQRGRRLSEQLFSSQEDQPSGRTSASPEHERPGLPGLPRVEATPGSAGSTTGINMEARGSTLQCLRDGRNNRTNLADRPLLREASADEMATEEAGVFPCPVGLRRHIYGALKRKEMLWTDLVNYFCHQEIQNDDQHISEVSFLIRQALQKQQPAIKRILSFTVCSHMH